MAECQLLPEYNADEDLKALITHLNSVQANDQQASETVYILTLLIHALQNLFEKLKTNNNIDRRTSAGKNLVQVLCREFETIMIELLPDEVSAIENKTKSYGDNLNAILCSDSSTRAKVITAFCDVNLMYIGMILPLCKDAKRNLTLSRTNVARALINANNILDSLLTGTEAQYPEGQAQILGPADQVENQPPRRRCRFWPF